MDDFKQFRILWYGQDTLEYFLYSKEYEFNKSYLRILKFAYAKNITWVTNQGKKKNVGKYFA